MRRECLIGLCVVTSAAVLVSLVACGGDSDNDEPAFERLTLLTVNLRGIFDVPCNDPAGNWRFRYANVGTGLRTAGAVPDVIALQEVNGWTWCTFNNRFMPDYGPLDELLTELARGTGVSYQIAYLNALSFAQGNFHCRTYGESQYACQAMQGLALLYNPNRIRNLMTEMPASEEDGAFAHNSPQQQGVHLRRSLPYCNPAVGSLISSRIDGPSQTDKCNRETPAGLAWISGAEMALARLEWTSRPGAVFHVYNLHLSFQVDVHKQHVDAVNNAVTGLEERFGGSRWIPPIMMGDFNNKSDEATLSEFPRFDWRGSAAVDDWILAGKPDAFPASARVTGHVTSEMPRISESEGGCHSAQFLWSDHCAVLTTLTIE